MLCLTDHAFHIMSSMSVKYKAFLYAVGTIRILLAICSD